MKVFSWGSNSHGQLGQDIDDEQLISPTPFYVGAEVKSITGGGKHTILLTTDYEIFTCGDNDKGQLGKELTIKSLKIFKPLQCSFKVTKVTCGWDFNLALTDNYEVLAWGSNSYGQLGLAFNKVPYVTSPVKVFEKAVAIAAGLRHSGVINSDGLVFTSGFGRKGQLGVVINNEIPLKVDKFVEVQNIRHCVEISCGECHCLVKTSTGKFFSWGHNRFGQLGVDPESTSCASTPIQINLPIENLNGSLFSGWASNFVLTENGQVISWGRNDFGQLGEPRKLNWKPELIKNLDEIKQICVGSHHSVGLTKTGDVISWGWNEHGNCGNGNCHNVENPYKFELKGVKFVGSGAAHSFLFM